VEEKDTVRAGDDGTTPNEGEEEEEEEEGQEETNTGSC
jgi:hypothetical protein